MIRRLSPVDTHRWAVVMLQSSLGLEVWFLPAACVNPQSSFAMKRQMYLQGFLFVPGSYEDFRMLDTLRQHKKKMVMSKHVTYFVKSSPVPGLFANITARAIINWRDRHARLSHMPIMYIMGWMDFPSLRLSWQATAATVTYDGCPDSRRTLLLCLLGIGEP
jgi:hypothetical protein